MKSILIIEDDQAIAELQRDYLMLSGFNVKIVNDGQKGIDSALKGKWDLIIVDLMLPNVDGFEICSNVRKVSNVPLMIVSAKVEDIDKIRGFNIGVDDYMTKPFSPSELVARVKAHIDRHEKLSNSKEVGNEIVIDNLKINIKSRKIFIDDNEIAMPNKEFDLLVFLAQNPNEAFSKEKLLNTVWGSDAYVEMATVAVHINRIREKIERDPSNPKIIQTVWGIGYCLAM